MARRSNSTFSGDGNPGGRRSSGATHWAAVTSVARRSRLPLVIATLVSLFLHFFGFRELSRYSGSRPPAPEVPTAITVKPLDQKTADDLQKRILEAKQQKTERPVDAKHLGEVDHKATKETRVDTSKTNQRMQDPGSKSSSSKAQKVAEVQKPQPARPASPSNLKIAKPVQQSPYAALMPTASELQKQVDAGYVGYVNDKIDLGDAIDINTTEFRYMGYFTNMRKAIELVWNYPYDAAVRGMQGSVGLTFTIKKDGSTEKIKVISSSGYKILDQAIVDAILLASPFAPLPPALKKDRLTITGNFTYTLSNVIGGH